jgi:hypothetical protein
MTRLIALAALTLFVAGCETHRYRTDETDAASPFVGRCFEVIRAFRVYPQMVVRDREPNAKDTVPASFSYDGHAVTWDASPNYGLLVPEGARLRVERVFATRYPYPKNTVIFSPYVRLDDEHGKLLIEASQLFVGPNGDIPEPSPYFLAACGEAGN